MATTWHPTLNGELTPHQIPPSAKHRVWWRCAAGHEWQDIVATRIGMPAWKGGDVAACKVCVGFHVIVAFDCGHTTDARAEYAEPHRGCPACRKVRREQLEADWFEQREANALAGRNAYAECEDRARELLTDIPVPDVPAPLLFEWRRCALHEIRVAIVREQRFGKTGTVGTMLDRQRRLAADLVPSVEELRAAVTAREPVRILDKAHWATGWLHLLNENHAAATRTGRDADFELIHQLATALTAKVTVLVEEYGRGDLPVTEVTRLLTVAVKQWADAQQTKCYSQRWIAYRELALPLAPGDSTRFGRLDLTIMRPDHPDVVVEIDSTHNPQAAQKLVFARDAGALAVWVRWGSGLIEVPDGVLVINLVETTRGLTAWSPSRRASMEGSKP